MKFFNSDLLPLIGFGDSDLASFIKQGKDHDPIGTYTKVLKALRNHTSVPVVYLLDEHNEIWKRNKQADPIFRDWTIGSSGPHGKRTFVVYSGSAHSPFETNLQSNMNRWVVKLQPLADLHIDHTSDGPIYSTRPSPAFIPFIKMGAFPIAGPLKLLLSKTKTKSATFQLIFDLTFGNPREIRYLLQHLADNWTDNSVSISEASEQWVSERQEALEIELRRFAARCHDAGTLDEFHTFLADWLEDPLPNGVPLNFADTGLLYQPQPKIKKLWKSTSAPAHRAILNYFWAKVAPSYTMSDVKPSVLGFRFEALLIVKLKIGHKFLHAWYFARSNEDVVLDLMNPFSDTRTLLECNTSPNKSDTPILYKPTSETFPSWDLVYHEPKTFSKRHRLVFMQITISTPQEHEQKRGQIVNSLRNLVPQVVHDITGGIDIKCSHDEETGMITWTNNDLVDLEFVVFTWKPKAEAVKLQPNRNYKNLPNNILIVSQQSLPFFPNPKPSSPR